jgi:hypothetical protein
MLTLSVRLTIVQRLLFDGHCSTVIELSPIFAGHSSSNSSLLSSPDQATIAIFSDLLLCVAEGYADCIR